MSAQTAAASTVHHPLGKPGGPGLFNVKGLMLPAYVENIARALLRTGRAKDTSSAIQLAIGAVQRWARGQGNVSPEVRAAAAKALAEWEAAKARAHAHANEGGRMIELVGPKGYDHNWKFVGIPGARTAKPSPEALRSMSPSEKKAYIKTGALPDRLKTGKVSASSAGKTAAARESVPVPRTKAALVHHMTEHHGGVPAGGRSVGPRRPSVAQVQANHAQQHATRRDLDHAHAVAATAPARSDAAPDVSTNAFSFTGQESGALLDYVSPDGAAAINGALRNGTMPSGDRAKSVQVIDGAIAKTQTIKPSTVYRGMSLPPGMDLSPGAVFKDDGFISTSSVAAQAKDFAVARATGKTAAGKTVAGMKALGGKPVVMAIHLPAGQHMVSGQPELREFILPRGSSFHVDSVDPGGTIHVGIQ